MNGFGFIEYEDAMDARDVVPGKWPSILHQVLPNVNKPLTAVFSTIAFRS